MIQIIGFLNFQTVWEQIQHRSINTKDIIEIKKERPRNRKDED